MELWDHCGKSTFSGCDRTMKTQDPTTRLGCRWSLVQIQSRRPIYPLVITSKSRDRRTKISARRLVVSCHFSSQVFGKIEGSLWDSSRNVFENYRARGRSFDRPDRGLLSIIAQHESHSKHQHDLGPGGSMARINIEDSLFKDQRWIDLVIEVKSAESAMGALVWLWLTAQKYWKRDRARIPKDAWTQQKLNPALITTGWAVWQDEHNGYFAEGSEAQFKWLLQKQEAGAAGGKASGESRHRDFDELEASGGKRDEAQASGAKPPTPTPTPTLSPSPSPVPSSSSSSSISISDGASDEASAGKPKPKRTRKPKVEDPDAGLRREVWEAYSEAYFNQWEVRLERNAGINSMIKTLVSNVGKDAVPLVRFYVAHKDGQYVRACHPMTLCLRDYLGLRTQMLRGQAITMADVREFERTQQQVSRMQQLRKVNL